MRCHCWLPSYGAIVVCYGLGGGWQPTLGEWMWCHCWVLLKRAMIGCQRDDQLWGSGYSIAGCPCTAMVSRKNIQKNCPELLTKITLFSILIIQKLVFTIWGLCCFFFEKSWLVIQKKSSQKGVTLMSGISPLAAWLRWLGSRDWRWWNIWIRFVRDVGFRDGHLSPPYSLAPGKVTWDDACWTARMKDKSRCFWYLEALHLCVKISRNRGVSHARALMKIRRLKTVVRMRHTFGRDKNRHYFGSFFFQSRGRRRLITCITI